MNVKWFITARCIQCPLRAVRGMRRAAGWYAPPRTPPHGSRDYVRLCHFRTCAQWFPKSCLRGCGGGGVSL